MKGIKKGLAILLVLCTLLSMVVMTGAGAAPQSADAGEAQTMAANGDFMKMVLLDGGRGHISVENVKAVINEMALYDYDYLMLGIGNDGLRFLLDDMSVTANDQTYSGETIKNAIVAKNNDLAPQAMGEWSEDDMNTILAYAQEKDISIVPMLNTPGHATSIVAAMTACGINAALDNRNKSTDDDSVTFDVTNADARAFMEAFVGKYITYFSSKCQYFNLGMDEFAGNNGGWSSMSSAERTALGTYLSDLVNKLNTAGMTPMAFCDVIGNMTTVPNSVIGINWDGKFLNGHRNINANCMWYYVLGATGNGWAGYDRALSYTKSTPVTTTLKDSTADAGSLLAIWNDNNLAFDGYLDNVKTLISTQATNNPTYFTPQVENPDPTPEEPTNTRNIWVPVGGTTKDTIEGGDFSGQVDKTKLDTSIATVSAEKTPIQGTTTYTRGDKVTSITSDGQYIIVNSRSGLTLQNETSGNGLLLSNANTPTVWTIAKAGSYYYVQNGNRYLSVGNKSASAGSQNRLYLEYNSGNGGFWDIRTESEIATGWFSSNYFYLNQYGGSDSPMAAGYTKSGSDDEGSRWEIYKAVEQTSEAGSVTDVTFNGVKEGITYATVGDVHYTIHVVPQAVANVTLTYHPWISSFAVYPEGYEGSYPEEGEAHDVKLQAMYAYSKEGVAFSDLVAPTGDWHWEEDAQTVYWKATILPNGSHQEGNKAKDQSMSGTDFTYLRYWDKVWSYSSDRVNWTPVQSTDEVCAYYLQQTAVTKEVDTYVKDWAFTTQNAASNGGGGRSQKALSFAVVYPSGQMSPAEGDIYSTSTLVYFDNLDPLTFIRVGVNEVYEVEKITYTFGARQTSSSNTAWQANDSINWEKTTTGGATWYKETTCWDETYRTEPVVNGADLAEEINAGTPHRKTDIGNMTDYDGTWGANDAVLILIYLKPVVTEDSLTVRYWDDSANSEIYQYPVNITNTTGVEKGTFLNRLEQNSAVNSGEFTLDDTAYVVNAKNQNETFQKDLTKVPNLFGKYTSGLYNYVKADISEDGKTLTLHYNLNADKLSKNFVLDFGLPVTIPLTEIAGKIDNVTGVTVTVPQSSANAVVNADRSITVTLSKVMTSAIPMTVTVTYNDNSTATFTVGLTPATTVYYEEGFATPYNSDATGGSKGAVAQTTEVVGKKQNVYGYDDAYNKVGDSNDSVMTLAAGKGAATFTFTGTGVDIYTRSTMETGSLMIRVMNSANKLVKVVSVNTVMKNGSSDSTSGQEVTAYNVPVVSLSGLTHGTYTLQIAAVKSGSAGAFDVYLDGFRVHGTLEDQSNSVYVADQEDNPTFVELRDEVLTAQNVNTDNSQYANQIAENVISQVYAVSNSTTGAVIMSNNTKLSDADMEDLLDNGPKNEIYLQPQQTLTFKISTNRVVQIGLKALNQATTYTINNDEKKPLNTSTDMFYTVLNKAESETEQTITITNTGNGILSITDLKVCDDPNATLGELTAEDLIPALVSLGFESEPVAATATLNITVQCGDKAVPVTLTHDGMSNETYTFTAAEIKAAVEQALPEGYTVADVTFSDVTVTCGEASDVAFTAAETPAPVGLLQKIVQIAVKIVKKIFSWF